MQEILENVVQELEEDSELGSPSSTLVTHIPTLEPNVYKEVTPQLLIRFTRLGNWIDSTHGDWLSTGEMEEIWNDDIADARIKMIKQNICAARDNWCDDAYSLFRPNRLSLFAGSSATSERIYLLWLESTLEPELWVYDTNGEARFKDLESYLKAYLEDDLSALDDQWKLHLK